MVLPAMSRHKMDSSSDLELLVETVSFSQRFSKIYHMQAFGEFRFIGNKAKGQISKRLLTEHVKFSEKQIFLTPDTHTCVHVSGNKECSFFGKFNVLCFFVTPILRFTLLLYYRRFVVCSYGKTFVVSLKKNGGYCWCGGKPTL